MESTAAKAGTKFMLPYKVERMHMEVCLLVATSLVNACYNNHDAQELMSGNRVG